MKRLSIISPHFLHDAHHIVRINGFALTLEKVGGMRGKLQKAQCLRRGYKGRALVASFGHVEVRVLRHVYGGNFAPAFQASHRLAQIVAILDQPSMDLLLRDFANGELKQKIEIAMAVPLLQ